MNSRERKEARYQRRKAEREKKRAETNAEFDNFESVISANALLDGARKSRRTIRFKASVQKYFMSLFRNVHNMRRRLQRGENITLGFIVFRLCDRGKERIIRSVHFAERIVQRAVCDRALVPRLSRSLIYDNGASLENKGIHFAMLRVRAHLQQYFRSNGFSNDGWILLIDFSSYFDNIQHGPIRELLEKSFHDERLIRLVWTFVEAFGEKSLGIGSQVSQILALAYPNAIDHYAKEVLRLRFYGRYMDDTYIIHRDKAVLEHALKKLLVKYEELGIVVNMKKTKIIPVRCFTFLKVRYFLTNSGKVVMKPCRRSITKMRRKLKKFRHFLDVGVMTMADITSAYESWRGYVGHMNAHKTIRTMDRLYFELFGITPKAKKGRR